MLAHNYLEEGENDYAIDQQKPGQKSIVEYFNWYLNAT